MSDSRHQTPPVPIIGVPASSNLIEDVLAFHIAGGIPVGAKPQFPSPDRVELRKKLVEEEYGELSLGIVSRDMTETADAIADLIYVLIGMALEFGIPLARVWNEVQRSNMAKFPGGLVTSRADGKILKPDGWTPPDIARIISEALA